MLDPSTITSLVHQVHTQHQELHRLLDEIAQRAGQLAAPDQAANAAAELKSLMPKLRVFLERHFQQEEQGGWLEEAACQLPRLSHSLTELEHEHRMLLQQTDEAIQLLAGPVEPAVGVATNLRSLVKSLLDHEAREEVVLAEGFNQEPDFAE
jgi:hemerythrin